MHRETHTLLLEFCDQLVETALVIQFCGLLVMFHAPPSFQCMCRFNLFNVKIVLDQASSAHAYNSLDTGKLKTTSYHDAYVCR